MKKTIIFSASIFVIVVGILILSLSMSKTKELSQIENNSTKKPVILIVIDSLMSEPVKKSIEQGKAPALSFLINNGQFHPEVISSYPTMSVTIDSTVMTGTYANQHHVPGLIWFNTEENRIVTYGSGISEIWNNGVKNVAKDSVINLNNEHLSKNVKTIHEELSTSNIQTASINGLLYRGTFEQQLNVPKMISLMQLLPKKIEVNGPKLLSLGTLSQYNPVNDSQKFVWNRMGVNNDFTVNELNYLIGQQKLPAFTLAYLPDADAKLHKYGPQDINAIEKADESLQQLLNAFPTWEEAIQEITWIVMGDSGQSPILEDNKTALIDLNEVLKDYTFWEREKPNNQLAIAINERMAYIYVNDPKVELSQIIKILKQDERIGLISWKDKNTNYVSTPESNQDLTFSPNGKTMDEYYQGWNLNGDLTVLDISLNNDGTIQYNNYPDGLARLHGSLHSHEGRYIIVDAKPNYEFIAEHSHDHAGGAAHGSLHKVDSVVPLIITGTDELPKYNRLVDLKDLIIRLVK